MRRHPPTAARRCLHPRSLSLCPRLLCLAADEAFIKVGVRWWDSGLEQHGGVPLKAPVGCEDLTYAVVDDRWHEQADEPFVNGQLRSERFPTHFDKHYR